MIAADPGFVGPAYQAPMSLQDAETCINWYVEVSEKPNGAKMPMALLGTPGLNPVISTGVSSAIRGMWALPSGQQMLFVVGNQVGIVTIAATGTRNTIPTFSTQFIGTLSTNTGPVSIADNGAFFGGQGGFAVLVDGVYGYYVLLDGNGNYATSSRQVTTVAQVTQGSATVAMTLGEAIPSGIAISAGTTVTDSLGYINATLLSVDFNALTMTLSAASTGTNPSDTLTITVPQFGKITDPAFLASSNVVFLEGYLVFNQVNSRTFFTTAATPYTLLFAGAFYALKDSSSDNLVTIAENNREIWLLGQRTSEVWAPTGLSANFYFSRIPGVGPQIGCAAAASITRIGNDLIWLAQNEQGQNFIAMSQQYSWKRVSDHGVDHAIASYPVVSDAIGYAYEEDGHFFYVLTFPTADSTWVFDLETGYWHQRLSYDPNAGVFHRHRSNCFANFANVRLVGDYQSGQIHQMSRGIYTDAGNPLICKRRSVHMWSREAGSTSRKRIFHSSIQVEFTPGVGLQTGQGASPQAMLRWSNDGGFTWSNEYWSTIGAAGQTKNRAMWRRLGRARDRIYELSFSDPTARDVIGATLFYEPEDEAEAA